MSYNTYGYNPYGPEYLDKYNKRRMTFDYITKAIKKGYVLEALVVSCNNDLELELTLGNGIVGKMPFSEIEYRTDGETVKPITAMSRVGRHIKFIPTSIEQDEETGKWIVKCSRKEAQKLCQEKFISKLVPGDIIDARIVRIENYGVFCDIGCGIISLLPTNYISVTHVINPKEFLSNTNRLKVVVKEIQPDGKLQLTHRELLGTWKEETSKLKAGTVVCGAILCIEDYGIFVRLSQNLSGLAKPVENMNLQAGDVVSVRIDKISESNKKIKLHIINKIDNCEEDIKFQYYIKNGHIDKWVYYDSDKKKIETDFTTSNKEST